MQKAHVIVAETPQDIEDQVNRWIKAMGDPVIQNLAQSSILIPQHSGKPSVSYVLTIIYREL